MHNKWNPYSEEYQNMPWIYWVLAFNFLQIKTQFDWTNTMLPHAELIGQLTHPEIFQEYKKIKKRAQIEEGADYYKDSADGIEGGGSANARYDPNVGLVDMKGNVIIPKEKYDQMFGLDGVAISY